MNEAGPPSVLVLLACACTPEEVEKTPPELIGVEFGPTTLEGFGPGSVVLRFSEPLGPIDEVDPRHFRISSGLVIDDASGEDLTVYYDLANHFDNGLPGYENIDDPQPFHDFTVVAELEFGANHSELILHLSYPVELSVCDAMIMANELGIPHGIFVHYTQADFPRIVDEAGNPLADISPDFAEKVTGLHTVWGSFPERDESLVLVCP